MVATSAGTHRSLVARTSKCGWTIRTRILKVQLLDDQPPYEFSVEEVDILIINMYSFCKFLGLGGALVSTPFAFYSG